MLIVCAMSVMHSLVSQVVQQRGIKDSDDGEDDANKDDTNGDEEIVANRANAGVAGDDGEDGEEVEKVEAKDSERTNDNPTLFAVGQEVNNKIMNH